VYESRKSKSVSKRHVNVQSEIETDLGETLGSEDQLQYEQSNASLEDDGVGVDVLQLGCGTNYTIIFGREQ
jgi:hypothetical protein